MSVTASNQKTILVTGATGKQGRAFISSMLSTGAAGQGFRILAVTRDPSSPAAKSLVSLGSGSNSDLELVKGDLDNLETIRTVFKNVEGGVWGVFMVLPFPGLGVSSDGEEAQGYAIADLSLEFGVSYFVYSSSERGGDVSDEDLQLGHGNVKAKIERHIKALNGSGFQWTILRPAFFMENFDGLIGRITVGVTRAGLQPNTTLDLIAADDIGHTAAAVFRDPERYYSKVVPVVGDTLTAREQEAAYREATKHSFPSIPTLLAKLLLNINSHTRDLMSDMERVYRAHSAMEGGSQRLIQETRQVYPGTMTFAEWAKKRGEREANASRAKGWNNVSIMSLVTGKL